MFDFNCFSKYAVLISLPISVHNRAPDHFSYAVSGCLKQTLHRIFFLPLLPTLSKQGSMLILERFLLQSRMSVPSTVGVSVLTSLTLFVLVLVVFVRVTFYPMLAISACCSKSP